MHLNRQRLRVHILSCVERHLRLTGAGGGNDEHQRATLGGLDLHRIDEEGLQHEVSRGVLQNRQGIVQIGLVGKIVLIDAEIESRKLH